MFNNSSNSKFKNISILIIFVFLIAWPILTIHWTGGEFSESEKRILAIKPVFFQDDGNWNPQIKSEFKSWFEDHIGLRDTFVKISSTIKLNIFHQSPSKQVHIGKDGWYYYTENENLQISNGEYTLTQDMLEQILINHSRIEKELNNRGMEYVIVLPTSKVSIYPEFIRYGDEKIIETPVDTVANYLEEHSNLKVVRLKETLLKEKEKHQVFYKTDTHWTQAGAYAAYCEIIRKMGEWGMCETEPVEASFVDAKYTGEFGTMMGVNLPPESVPNIILKSKNACIDITSYQYQMLTEVINKENIQTPYWHYLNPVVCDKSVVMFGDSMFGGEWNVRESLAENFSEFTYVWDRNIHKKIIEVMSPNVVIYEMTERYLNQFPQANITFIQKPLADFSSSILEYEWEDDLLKVVVENNSYSEWNYIDQVKLGLFSNGKDTGIRALLPMGKIIKPGERVIFKIPLEHSSDLLNTKLEVGMLQEGIAYFYERGTIINSISTR